MGKGQWAAVDRRPGESADSWRRRNHEAYRDSWKQQKQTRGAWLSAEEYQRRTGRPGAKDSGVFRQPPPAPSVSDPGPRPLEGQDPRAAVVESATMLPLVSPEQMASDALSTGAVGAALSLGKSMLDGRDLATAMRGAAADGAVGAARSVAQEGVERGLRFAVSRASKSAVRAVAKSNALTHVAAVVVQQGVETARLARGSIDGGEYGRRTAENVGGVAGSAGGAVLGAAVGTALLPGIGTAIGGFLGGLAGGETARGLIKRVTRR